MILAGFSDAVGGFRKECPARRPTVSVLFATRCGSWSAARRYRSDDTGASLWSPGTRRLQRHGRRDGPLTAAWKSGSADGARRKLQSGSALRHTGQRSKSEIPSLAANASIAGRRVRLGSKTQLITAAGANSANHSTPDMCDLHSKVSHVPRADIVVAREPASVISSPNGALV